MPAPVYHDTVGQIVRITGAGVYPLGVTGQQVEEMNVCYVCTVSGGGDSRAAVLGNVEANMRAVMRPLMATSTKWYGAKLSTYNLTPPPAALTIVANLAGTGPSGISLPTQVRGLLRWQTAVGGRTGRGRMYVFTPEESFMDGSSNPTAPYLAAITSLANDLAVPIVSGGSTWNVCVAHRHIGPPVSYSYDLVTSNGRDGGWVTQRRSGESGRINVLPW